jgi:hypothetical protein
MTQKLALFPLQIVVFPGETLNLHIFESRYQQLITDAEKDGVTFAVPTVIDGGLLPIATELTLSEVAKRYPSGESDIRAIGGRVFFVEEFWKVMPDKLYPGANVRELPVYNDEDLALNKKIISLTRSIYDSLGVDKIVKDVDEGFKTYDIAHYVGMQLEQEYEFLTMRHARSRQEFLLGHLQNVQPEVEKNTKIRQRAQLNGHFQELTPPNW